MTLYVRAETLTAEVETLQVRPATISDLKEVLSNLTPEQMEELGAFIDLTFEAPNGEEVIGTGTHRPGRYLVVKL